MVKFLSGGNLRGLHQNVPFWIKWDMIAGDEMGTFQEWEQQVEQHLQECGLSIKDLPDQYKPSSRKHMLNWENEWLGDGRNFYHFNNADFLCHLCGIIKLLCKALTIERERNGKEQKATGKNRSTKPDNGPAAGNGRQA